MDEGPYHRELGFYPDDPDINCQHLWDECSQLYGGYTMGVACHIAGIDVAVGHGCSIVQKKAVVLIRLHYRLIEFKKRV